MIKILHSADWHLDSPITGRSEAQTALLRAALLTVPGKITAICKAEQCDLMLLSGDLFDGSYTADSLQAVKNALEEAAVPVFIAPGNHDFLDSNSPWQKERWPDNVHIFTQNQMTAISLPGLACRIYGAAFTGPDCEPLLENFQADTDLPAIGILHGDPTQRQSPYCPITQQQVQQSGLTYLALGHIHKGGSFRSGSTLCVWPGCPMGRGFDELEEKGVQIVTIEDNEASARFIPLDVPRFYDWEIPAGEDAAAALDTLLPPVGNDHFYRITIIGESEPLDMDGLYRQFSRFTNLELRDRTRPPIDLWATAGEDSLEGVYFRMLQQQLEAADEETKKQILLAAKLSRQILENREVKLP